VKLVFNSSELSEELRAIRLKAGFSLPAAGAGLLSTDYSQKLKFKLKLKEIKVKV